MHGGGGYEIYGIDFEVLNQIARLCSVLFVWYVVKTFGNVDIKCVNVIGRETLCIYILHYFFIRDGLSNWIEKVTASNNMLEVFVCLGIAITISYICIGIKKLFSFSSIFSLVLFGKTKCS